MVRTYPPIWPVSITISSTCSYTFYECTARAAGELFLFGGITHDGTRNDLYVISTRDFSTTLLQTSGDVPSPRYGHRAVLTSTILMIWGGGEKNVRDQNKQNQAVDNSLYLLNLGTPDLFHVKTRSSLIRVSFQYRESGPKSWSMVPGPAVVTTTP